MISGKKIKKITRKNSPPSSRLVCWLFGSLAFSPSPVRDVLWLGSCRGDLAEDWKIGRWMLRKSDGIL